MLPQIDNGIQSLVLYAEQPSLTYLYTENEMIGHINGIEAVKQAIYHMLSTERYDYVIYDNNYGIEFRKYIGKSLDYIEATMAETLSSCLLQDDRIIEILNIEVAQIDKNSVVIKFDAITKQQKIGVETFLNV